MERRTLELIAEGSSLGDSYVFNLEPPMGKVHLDETTVFGLKLLPEGDSASPQVLRFEKGSGIEGPDGRWDGENRDDGSVHFDINLLLRGKKGPSMLKIIVKSEEFRATLAFTEVPLELGSSKLDVSIPEWPLRWDGNSPMEIGIELTHRGGGKVNVQSSLQILDGNGNILMKGDAAETIVKNNSIVKTIIDPGRLIDFDALSVRVELLVDGEHQDKLITSAILPLKEKKIKVGLPGRIISGEEFSVILEIPDGQPLDGLELTLGDLGPISPEEIKGDSNTREVLFRVPEMNKGMVPLVLILGEEEVTRSPVFIDQLEVFDRILLDFEPTSVSPGEKVRIKLDVKMTSDIGPLRVLLEFNRKNLPDLDLGELPQNRTLDHIIDLPEDLGIGDIGGKLRFLKGEEEVGGEAHARFFTIRSRSNLGLEVILPGQLDTERSEPLLLPGETITDSREYSEGSIHYLNSGRVLIKLGERVIPDKEEGVDLASRIILLDTFLETLTKPDVHKRMLSSLEHLKKVTSLLLSSSDGTRDTKDTGFLGYFSKYLQNGTDEPAYCIHSTDGKDPVSNLSAVLKELLAEDGIGHRSDPSSSLRDLVEHIMKGMKGRDSKLDRGLVGKNLIEISKRGKDALKDLRSLQKGSVIDLETASGSLKRICFYLIALSLVRAEVFSQWSDPVVTAWDQIRIERQRAIKGSIQSIGDTVSMICDIWNASRQRWEAYRNNTVTRYRFASFDGLDIKVENGGFSGMSGDVWECVVSISSKELSPRSKITPYLSFPKGGWSLEVPLSTREENNLILEPITVGEGSMREITLRIRAPSVTSGDEMAMMYLHPQDMHLEEEP